MSHGRKFGHQGARGRRSFSTNLRRATEGMPVAVFEDDADLKVPVEKLTAALAKKDPKTPSYDRALGELGQAVARFLRGSGNCGEQDIEFAVTAMNSFVDRRRVGDLRPEDFSAAVVGILDMTESLEPPLRGRALEVTAFAAQVVARENLPSIPADIAAVAAVPVFNAPRMHLLDMIATRLATEDVRFGGAQFHQLVCQLTGGIK